MASVHTKNAPASRAPFARLERAPKRSGVLKWFLLVALILGAAWGGNAVFSKPHPELFLAEVRQRKLEAWFAAEGVVRAKEYLIAPEVTGRIARLLVAEGATVTKGTTLLELESADVDSSIREAESAVASASAAVRQAQAEEALARTQVRVRIAAASARVKEAQARLQRVREGARAEEIAQARQRLAAADVALTEAGQSYERARFLYGEGALSRASFQAAEARLGATRAQRAEADAALSLLEAGPSGSEVAAARAAVDSALADLDAARASSIEVGAKSEQVSVARAAVGRAQASFDLAKSRLGKTILRAPASGTISKLAVEAGDIAPAGVAAMTLVSREDLRIEAEMSTEDAAKCVRGMPVEVSLPGQPGRTYKATLDRLAASGELKPMSTVRARIVRATIRISGHQELFIPGIEVDVQGAGSLGTVNTTPSDAIDLIAGRTYVWVVADGIAHKRAVSIGHEGPEWTEVLSGVPPGARVVVRGKEGLTDGARVKVVR